MPESAAQPPAASSEPAQAYTAPRPSPPALDPGRERRVKALTCTEPLHALQANRSRRNWDRVDFYDLGLAAVDAVVDRMGFASGISRPELEAILEQEAHRFWLEADAAEIHNVVVELIETLVRPNASEYLSAVDAVRRRFDFALLSEHEDPEGGIYLRASNEAINVLIGGLNTDIESAQVAAEATLDHLIRRHRLDDAARPAREARIRSIQYASHVRQLIEDTRRDVRRAGWREEAPKLLMEIRQHLDDRMTVENQLLTAMQEARDTAGREDLRRQAAALVETVDDCYSRHVELHAITLAAIKAFVEEQDRQVFGRAATFGAIDLTEEALRPVLAARVGNAADLLTRFAERLLGTPPGPQSKTLCPLQPRLGVFLQSLLRPPQPRDQLGEAIDLPEWEEPPADPFAFSFEAWAATDGILDELDPPRRLSDLLAGTEAAHGFEAADLLRLQAVFATAPELETGRPESAPVLAAGNDGKTFASASFHGADLLVGTLRIQETPPEPDWTAPPDPGNPDQLSLGDLRPARRTPREETHE
jgi:hypothetical protein